MCDDTFDPKVGLVLREMRRYELSKLTVFLAVSILVIGALAANTDTLFSDDFEAGLGNMWVFSERGGEGDWNVVKENGNGILQKTGSSWTIISVDGVGGVSDGKEVWATARIRCDVAAADEGTELGLLTNPDDSSGNWYFTVRAISGQAGFDELSKTWHALVPYPDWSVGEWHRVKIAVIDGVFYGKVWSDGDDEPGDWISQIELTSHLEEDGVGFATDTNEVSFDDLIVGDSEDSLASAVDPGDKLSVAWGKVKTDI